MGIDNLVNVIFQDRGDASITLVSRGILCLMLQDVQSKIGTYNIENLSDIPSGLKEENIKAINLALDTGVKKVVAYISLLNTALTWDPSVDKSFKELEGMDFDYLVLPGISAQDSEKVATWAKKVNEKARHRFKVVLPKTEADDEHIINFYSDNIIYKGVKYKNTDFTPYIAGYIAATDPKKSITYSVAKGVEDVEFMSSNEIDQATKQGKLLLFKERNKVRFASGVNSLTTINGANKDESYQQIKIIETMDMFYNALKSALLEKYIGKFNNTYQNKLLLVSEIYKLIGEFEQAGLVEQDDSLVTLDYEAQKTYLKKIGFVSKTGKGVDELNKEEVLRANTKENVFIKVRFLPVGAIESIQIIVET